MVLGDYLHEGVILEAYLIILKYIIILYKYEVSREWDCTSSVGVTVSCRPGWAVAASVARF